GYALDDVEGMWRIVQLGEGDDFVLATGETHSVREFVEAAFAHADLDWKQFVKHDLRYERPAEVDLLLGDASKAKKILRWEPKVRFHELVRIMVDADVDLFSRGTPRGRRGKSPKPGGRAPPPGHRSATCLPLTHHKWCCVCR